MYSTIVKNYFEYLRRYYGEHHVLRTNKNMMLELLRCSLCEKLELQYTKPTSISDIEIESCGNYILLGIKYSKWTADYRIGILEACVKTLSIAQNKGE